MSDVIADRIARQVLRSIKFRARKVPPRTEDRALRRILSQLDVAERGMRELGGQWSTTAAQDLRAVSNRISRRLLELSRQEGARR